MGRRPGPPNPPYAPDPREPEPGSTTAESAEGDGVVIAASGHPADDLVALFESIVKDEGDQERRAPWWLFSVRDTATGRKLRELTQMGTAIQADVDDEDEDSALEARRRAILEKIDARGPLPKGV